jgi:hypothetical protein
MYVHPGSGGARIVWQGRGSSCGAVAFLSYLSNVAARIYLPFGENLTNDTGTESSSMSVLRHCPVAVSHIRLWSGRKYTRQKDTR